MRYLAQLSDGSFVDIEIDDPNREGIAFWIARAYRERDGWLVDNNGGAHNLRHVKHLQPDPIEEEEGEEEGEPVSPREGDVLGVFAANLAERLNGLRWTHNTRFERERTTPSLPAQRESMDGRPPLAPDPGDPGDSDD